jgi:hypothetical protein
MEDAIIYKVYRLFGAGLSYYGSTHQPLYERKSTHKSQHKNGRVCCSSKIIMDACEDWDLEVVELLPIGSTEIDALLREKWWIDNNECVNINSPIQTVDELKEYKRKWAEQNRRAKGVQPKNTEYDDKKCKAEWAKAKRASLTEEERAEKLAKRREDYAKKEQTEEQKEKASERAKKQREKLKEDPVKAEEMREYKKLKAREARKLKKEALSNI